MLRVSCRILVALLIGLLATAARAELAWVGMAERAGLASDAEWLALGHYAQRTLLPGHRSYADDRRFFLDEHGDVDPARELRATLEAFFAEPATQCRFVARRAWLSERLPGLAAALPPVACTEYDEWRALLGADHVVLVFAASYLNSPSSMYGHTFLRIDSGKATQDSSWLSYALNFGAAIPADENGFRYAVLGLAGGYPGQFAGAPYFRKLREYSRLENRDLWEYHLNLSPAEVDRLLQHVWELRDIVFDYYFFDENCSMRLLELLDVARPGHAMAEEFPRYAIPIDTVRVVRDAGLVERVDYRPANLTVATHERAALTPAERELALALAANPALASADDFLALPAPRQAAVAAAAYGHVRYRLSRRPGEEALVTNGFALLTLVNKLPPPGTPPVPRPDRPDDGHETMLLAAAAGIEEGRAFADFEWRISYHDLLDDAAGYPAHASLNMGRFVVRAREGGTVQLQRFDVIEITSLAPRDEFLKPLSWRVNAGLERQWTGGDDILVTQANAGGGFTLEPVPGLAVSALATARIEYNHAKRSEFDVAPGATLFATGVTRWGRTQVGAQAWQFIDGTGRLELSAAHDVSLQRNLALRFGYAHRTSGPDHVGEAGLALRYFF